MTEKRKSRSGTPGNLRPESQAKIKSYHSTDESEADLGVLMVRWKCSRGEAIRKALHLAAIGQYLGDFKELKEST